MLRAIDGLPEAEREAFELVRIQGLPNAEAAEPGDELSSNRPCAATWPDAHLVV